jgi:hypothetical protein
MAGLNYATALIKGRPKSKTGKFPYVTLPDGRLISDSSAIIEELTREYNVPLDAHLSHQEKIQAALLKRTLEEHFYWLVVWTRWARPAGFAHLAVDYFAHLPPIIRNIVPTIAKSTALKQLHAQGIGRQPEARILTLAQQDLDAIDGLIDGKPTVFTKLSTSDAIALGFLGAALATPGDCPIAALIRKRPRLVAYTENLRAQWLASPAPRAKS